MTPVVVLPSFTATVNAVAPVFGVAEVSMTGQASEAPLALELETPAPSWST
jgi:hypothetical protein